MPECPKDRKKCGFAIRYLRWLSESGAVNDIGPDAFALVVAVVLTEDALHYSRPPSFYNHQLLQRCGIGSIPALIRARQRAVEAGILVYLPGAKRRPGIYFAFGFPNESLPNPEGTVIESVLYPEQNVSSPNPLPLPKQKRTRNKSAGFDPSGHELPEELKAESFLKAWADWIKHRKEKRKPLTPTSTERQLQSLASMGLERAITAINHSIEKGWVGIFEPDQTRTPSDTRNLPEPQYRDLFGRKGIP